MHTHRVLAVVAATALTAGLTGLSAAAAGPASALPEANRGETAWVVLTDTAASADAVAAELRAAGATVTAVNDAVGLLAVRSTDTDFRATAAGLAGVEGVATDVSIGSAPRRADDIAAVEREQLASGADGRATARRHGTKPAGADPLDDLLWGMDMINAPAAHRRELGDRRVTVGVLDTGIQADHPDLAPTVDRAKSRNFVTDIPAIDGPCESSDCVDPATEDDAGHGTHVAGTIAAARNGFGVSGVAPGVTLVNIRGGQDSGYFFLTPVVEALTYAGDIGIDVVNMSFYVDPWLFNCVGGAPEDSPEAAADQRVILRAMTRALDYAHRKGVTLVGSLGNSHDDKSHPRPDDSSPDYDNPDVTWDDAGAYLRTVDGRTCFDLPVEGPHVLGISAVGPSGAKADYSDYTTEPKSGEIEFAAPGGWYRDGFGTDTFRTNENLILSSVPLVSLQDTGEVDADGNITELGEETGVIKECTDTPAPGATECGYYAYYQGTSMAAPHASGVAALAVSAHGHPDGRRGRDRGLTMNPNTVAALMARTATDHACPEGGVQDYLDEGRTEEFTATCVGGRRFNGFYGHGIVDALGVVR